MSMRPYRMASTVWRHHFDLTHLLTFPVVISYYAPLVFEEAGWIGRDAILMTGINSLVYVASTIPP